MYNVNRKTDTTKYRLLKAGGAFLCQLQQPELKMNLGKYLMLAETEDVFITKNGKVIAKLTNPNADRVEMAKSLFGVIPADVTVEEARDERLDNI